MKKILYLITQSELGGATIYVRDLMVNLKSDYDIIVAAQEKIELSWLKKECGKNEIKFYKLKNLKREINNPLKDFLAIWEIRQLIKKIRPDIVHLNSSKISILGSLAAFKLPTKIIYTVHGWVFNEPLSFFKKNLYFFLEKFTAKFKDKLICVSETDYKLALKNKIAKKEKLCTIHNGINLKYTLEKNDSRQRLINLSQGLEIKNNCILTGSIGNLYKNKGYEYLIHAIKILSDLKINIKHVILGTGREKANLENEIAQLKLKDKIFIIENQENAAQFLKAFNIYVCSSVKEGLSYTIIEAMMAELPIVATNVGGNLELLEHEKNGLVVESKNSKQIAKAILKLVNNPEITKNYAKFAQKKALEKFSLRQMINKTKKIYN